MTFEDTINEAVEKAVEKTFTIERATEIFVQKYEGKVADVKFIATLLDVSTKSVLNAIKDRKIKPLPRKGFADWKFDMAYALKLKRSDVIRVAQ